MSKPVPWTTQKMWIRSAIILNRPWYNLGKIIRLRISIFFIFRKLTEFFFKYEKIAKVIFKMFRFFFSNKIFYEHFFFGENFFIEFFLAKIFFSQKYFSEDFFHNIFSNFFCIWYLRNNVFCEIFYSEFCLLRIFLFCNFSVRKKNCKCFLRFFFSAINVNTKFENFLFWKKVKFFLIVLLDFFTHY